MQQTQITFAEQALIEAAGAKDRVVESTMDEPAINKIHLRNLQVLLFLILENVILVNILGEHGDIR